MVTAQQIGFQGLPLPVGLGDGIFVQAMLVKCLRYINQATKSGNSQRQFPILNATVTVAAPTGLFIGCPTDDFQMGSNHPVQQIPGDSLAGGYLSINRLVKGLAGCIHIAAIRKKVIRLIVILNGLPHDFQRIIR